MVVDMEGMILLGSSIIVNMDILRMGAFADAYVGAYVDASMGVSVGAYMGAFAAYMNTNMQIAA